MFVSKPFTTNANTLGALEDTLNRFFTAPVASRPWTPPVDIIETEQELILKADVPEMTEKDIAISIEKGTLTIKGERNFEKKDDTASYHRIERGYGSFARSFGLPETVDPEKVSAAYKNGVLTVTLPKMELAKPRTIEVKVS